MTPIQPPGSTNFTNARMRRKSWTSLSILLTLSCSGYLSVAEAREAAPEKEVPLEAVELELAEAPDALKTGKVKTNVARSGQEDVLPEVTVREKHEKHDKESYQGHKTRIGKTDQLPKDIPQSVTIVPEQLIRDRGANTLKEALRNVPGLTFNAGEGGRIGDNITIRGYAAVGDIYLDGLRDMAQYNRETFNLDQVEVLRGSASMLYGRGSTGGLINQVTKHPEEEDFYILNVTGGSNRYLRATSDINKTFGEKFAARLTSMITTDSSFRDGPRYRRWGFAPSFVWHPRPGDDVSLSYYFLKENNVPDYGVPYFRGRPLDVPITRFYGMANADYERNHASIATARWIHRFNENHVLRSTFRHADYARDLRATAARFIGTPLSYEDDTPIRRQRQARGGKEHVLTSQTEYNGKFRTGFLKHDVLAGYEYTWEHSHRWTNASAFTNPLTTVGHPDNTPELPFGFYDSFSRINFNYYNGKTHSLYAQNVMQVMPHVKAMMGTRFDRMRVSYKRPAQDGGPLDRRDNVWSYRGGLLYQPNELSTYYLSYGSSFNPSAELYQLDNRTANTPPERSHNMEAGGKWELFNGNLSLRTAVFRSQKYNERNTDLSRPQVSLLSGRRHTDGVELEAAGRITRKWQVFGGMALMRSNIDKASGQQIGSLNKRPQNTPNYTYNFWTTYSFRFHGNWKIGGGIEGVGQRYANAGTALTLRSVPAYHRVDAMLEYSVKQYALKLNVFNLLNRKYYEGVYSGHVVPGTNRAVQLTVSMKF